VVSSFVGGSGSADQSTWKGPLGSSGYLGISVCLGGFAAAKERIRHTVEESDDKRHTRGLSLPEETDTRLCCRVGAPELLTS
jgi:hypothetical protein